MIKASSVVAKSRNNLGKEFHNLGLSTENARMLHQFRWNHDTTS